MNHPVLGGENVESRMSKHTQGQPVRQERDRRKRNLNFHGMMNCIIVRNKKEFL